MNNKLSSLMSRNKGYEWQFCSLGGVTRVNISTGEDIAHLGELDPKLWTVLSCPVKGLEFDERTLQLMDTDKDGKIRIDEVISASQWLCKVLKSPDTLLKEQDYIDFADINTDCEEGAQMLTYARQIMKAQGLEKESLSLAELKDYLDHHEEICKNELLADANAVQIVCPYGENSDAAVQAVAAVRDKVADFFIRCKFIQFHADSSAALDVSVEKVAAISDNNLSISKDEIAKYPLAHPNAEAVLPIQKGINPAWQTAFAQVKKLVLDVDFPDKESLTEEEWNASVAKVDAYVASKEEKAKGEDESLNNRIQTECDMVTPLEKLLLFNKNFYSLLRNYVMMRDFYDGTKSAIFQCGKLVIDSRCLTLCMQVTDMAAHADMARLSGMFLIYCTCTSKVKNQSMNIVAILTEGDLDNLRVGKNAIFYDRNGLDWDATITKIVDNPISVKQAFWMPYKKFWNWVTEKINKSATEKEAKAFESMTKKAEEVKLNNKTEDKKAETPKKQAFDIAKFAGIFAAIGMAVGYIAGAFTGLFKAFMNTPSSIILLILIIMLCVSGPSMFIAWSKLRKRNLGPLLNANGWAINATVLVNSRFGATLTEVASYPKLMLDDPFAEKRMPKWKRYLLSLATTFVILFCLLYFKGYFNRYDTVKALHYDESSVIYRVNNKLFGKMKANLEEASEGLTNAMIQEQPADSTATATTLVNPAPAVPAE